MEAQQSGFHWERTSDGMSEPCPLGRGERYEVREDEIGRFKGMGFLREGADSPYQGEMSRRDKRGRVLEIPLPLDSSKVNCPEGAREGGLGHLATFCLHRKSLAPEGETSPSPALRRYQTGAQRSGSVLERRYNEMTES